MAITEAFREAVKNGNIKGIRIMMKDSLLVDPSFKEFAEMELAVSQLNNIYDTHDGHELLSDESLWDENYMNKLMVRIVGNFSHERVEHLKKVVRKLYPATTIIQSSVIPSSQKQNGNSQQKYQHPQQRSYQEQKAHDQRSGSYRGAKIAGGAVVGAVVGGMIATPVIGAAVGAVVGGAIVAVATKEEH